MAEDKGVQSLSGLIRQGTVLVRADTRLPASLTAVQSLSVMGWNLLSEWPAEAFHHTLKEAGWKFFGIGAPISVSASGRSVENMLEKLLGRVAKTVDRRECNCFEITEIAVTRALFFNVVRLEAQARHAQKGSQGKVASGVTPE